MPEQVAVTNGASLKQRLMLRNAAVQLQDCYGNAACGGGVQVRFRLRSPAAAQGQGGAQVPELSVAQGLGPQETDERGRAFLGDVSVVEGSGAGGCRVRWWGGVAMGVEGLRYSVNVVPASTSVDGC